MMALDPRRNPRPRRPRSAPPRGAPKRIRAANGADRDAVASGLGRGCLCDGEGGYGAEMKSNRIQYLSHVAWWLSGYMMARTAVTDSTWQALQALIPLAAYALIESYFEKRKIYSQRKPP